MARWLLRNRFLFIHLLCTLSATFPGMFWTALCNVPSPMGPWAHYARSDPRGNQTYEILMGSSARERIRREQQTHHLTPEPFYHPWRNIRNSKILRRIYFYFIQLSFTRVASTWKQYGTAWVRIRGPACIFCRLCFSDWCRNVARDIFI